MESNPDRFISFIDGQHAREISRYEDSFLEKTMVSRSAILAKNTLEEYLHFLREHPGEVEHLLLSLKNSYSQFFRNPLTFTILEQVILPILFRKKKKSNTAEIRSWSAGCASGQEPYSMAILMETFLQTHQLIHPFRIFATDNSEKEIELAKRGVYDLGSLENARLIHLNTFFKKTGQGYHISDSLRQKVDFSVYDLLDNGSVAPPASIYGGFDLIFCSNVLYYYKPEYQNLLLNKFNKTLNEGGFFITGEAETSIVRPADGFRQFTALAPIFVKV